MLPVDPLEARLVRLARSPLLRAETFASVSYEADTFPLRAFAWGDPALPAVLVFAGIHGDEPETVEAAVRLLERLADGDVPLVRHRLLVVPCLNPSGLADGTRSNRAGQDINRQFYDHHTPETAALRRFLHFRHVAAVADLHMDPGATGFYLFELRQEGVPPLAGAVLNTLTAAGFPLEKRPFYAGFVGANGLFAPTPEQVGEFQRTAPGQSLSEWAWAGGVPRSYPLEAPTRGAPGQGAAMHLAALLALFHALEEGEG